VSPESGTAGSAIEVEDVAKSFGTLAAIRRCDLTVAAGSFVSILGPSGCGKTTLLRIVAGFERQDRGSVRIHGEAVDRLPPDKRNVNTVFQRYALFPHKTVYENVVFPLEVRRVPRRERAGRVKEMLELVRLTGFESQSATTLSGGQAQRVALARALVGRPSVLLLDEPLAALDLKLRKAMQLELRRIQEQLGTTFVYVTHDQEEALTMSDSVVLMNDGEVVQVGAPREVYDRPASLFVSQFVGETNSLPVTVLDGTRVQCGQTVLSAPASDLAAGSEATLVIRPERLRLSAANGDARNGVNTVAGQVERTVFLGSAERLLVSTPDAGALAVDVGRDGLRNVPPGTPVSVEWESEDALLLGGPAA
jgi:spermidine/putrescine transport system ATP-binding protein